MALLGRIIGGVRALFHKTQVEREMDEELRAYLEIAVEEKMSAGMRREAAVRAARVEMGGLEAVKDQVRDAGWESTADSVWQDVRYAVRGLRHSPGFATVAILTLALGIGTNTAIFSVVNTLLLRALPVTEPQRLATISGSGTTDRWGLSVWSYAMWDEIRRRAQLFDGALAWDLQRFNLAQSGETDPVDGLYVSGGFFTTLGVPALLGRTFSSADDVRGGGPDGPVSVISYGFWQRRFGGATSVIGTELVVEGMPFTIIGVTPPEFFGAEVGRTFDVALPLTAEELIRGKNTNLDDKDASWLVLMLRLKPGQSLAAATAALRAVQPQIREGALPQNVPARVRENFLRRPLTLLAAATGTSSMRSQYERSLITLLVVVATVLLIACANIANLLLARATARQHEWSVRLALGAPRWRLARQLLVESLILAGVGSVAGLSFAVWGSRALPGQLPTFANSVFLDLSIDWRVLAFTVAVAAATAVLFGTAPAFRATRSAPIEALKANGRSGEDGRVSHSSGLVIAQVALSLVLVIVAGLFVRSFARLASVRLGFDSDRVLVVDVNTTRAGIDPSTRSLFYRRLVEAVSAVPGVAHAAMSGHTPVSRAGIRYSVEVPGASPISEQDRLVMVHQITPGWFATYGTAIRAGRDIDPHDTATALPIVIVNDAFVRQFLPGQDVIGRTLTEPNFRGPGTQPPRTIVGVVADSVYSSLREKAPPTIYVPLEQSVAATRPIVSLSVRSAGGSPAALARGVGAALSEVDRSVAFSFRPLEDQVNASLAQERLLAMLSAFFGVLALLLAGLGLYGITSYAVTRRRTEIGIRMALGAQAATVIRLVLGRSLAMTALGIVLGLVLAVGVTRYLESMLFGLTPSDPATFIFVTVMFAAMATLAAFLPARRATKVDPLIALRAE
jgi:putative ABC transport system permease protein